MTANCQLPTKLELQKFFAEVDGLASSRPEPKIEDISHPELETFFNEFNRRHTKAEQKQRQYDALHASRFNYFHLLDPDENKLSEVLAFLLDPRESHGQGPTFLQLLFTQLQLPVPAAHAQSATVHCEAPTHLINNTRRRIDVLIEAGKYIAIENKVDSWEQDDQVKDYLEHLARLAGKPEDAVLIYLSPNGRLPDSTDPAEIRRLLNSSRLRCWSYQEEFRTWLEQCHQACQASRIRDFISDFLGYIATSLQREPEPETEEESNEC